MYKLSLSILLIFLSHTLLLADSPIKNTEKGENLRYVIHYGIIRGGKASLKIRSEKIDGKDLYHATLTGKTIGLFNSLYKVKDTYESFINTETLLPEKAIRDIREGNYKRYTEIVFNREKNEVNSTRSGIHKVPEGTHDILSAFYFARANHFNSNLKVGEVVKIQTHFSDELFLLQFRFMGYETINSKIGDVNCYKFIPIVATGRAFKDEDDMTIWISADANRIPVRVQFDLFIGSLRCDLINFSDFSYDSLLDND
ncbi:DUF3108 domain-containing protein [Labilibaculum manganireducens]|uniref:ATP-dependent exonuclease n=1 Tax=Labilibaculum manganireducens TaxID=1940525 RepID=A0A2N3I4X2_9BACT|nr:DUF3108 domain-containing protein [Labilibaculum manganireducens]PKQ65355.1 hypothetical protein BZG01_12915 [Labilibaculum manganireducens]